MAKVISHYPRTEVLLENPSRMKKGSPPADCTATEIDRRDLPACPHSSSVTHQSDGWFFRQTSKRLLPHIAPWKGELQISDPVWVLKL